MAVELNDAAKCCNTLIPRAVGDLKSIARRAYPEAETMPEQFKEMLLTLRNIQDQLEFQFPELVK